MIEGTCHDDKTRRAAAATKQQLLLHVSVVVVIYLGIGDISRPSSLSRGSDPRLTALSLS